MPPDHVITKARMIVFTMPISTVRIGALHQPGSPASAAPIPKHQRIEHLDLTPSAPTISRFERRRGSTCRCGVRITST